jgi:hypothetical protein
MDKDHRPSVSDKEDIVWEALSTSEDNIKIGLGGMVCGRLTKFSLAWNIMLVLCELRCALCCHSFDYFLVISCVFHSSYFLILRFVYLLYFRFTYLITFLASSLFSSSLLTSFILSVFLSFFLFIFIFLSFYRFTVLNFTLHFISFLTCPLLPSILPR